MEAKFSQAQIEKAQTAMVSDIVKAAREGGDTFCLNGAYLTLAVDVFGLDISDRTREILQDPYASLRFDSKGFIGANKNVVIKNIKETLDGIDQFAGLLKFELREYGKED